MGKFLDELKLLLGKKVGKEDDRKPMRVQKFRGKRGSRVQKVKVVGMFYPLFRRAVYEVVRGDAKGMARLLKDNWIFSSAKEMATVCASLDDIIKNGGVSKLKKINFKGKAILFAAIYKMTCFFL